MDEDLVTTQRGSNRKGWWAGTEKSPKARAGGSSEESQKRVLRTQPLEPHLEAAARVMYVGEGNGVTIGLQLQGRKETVRRGSSARQSFHLLREHGCFFCRATGDVSTLHSVQKLRRITYGRRRTGGVQVEALRRPRGAAFESRSQPRVSARPRFETSFLASTHLISCKSPDEATILCSASYTR